MGQTTFPDGGKLYYDIVGGRVDFTAERNDGLDRETQVTFATTLGAPHVERTLTVRQTGRRERYLVSEGKYMLSDGTCYAVLKQA